VWKPGFPASWKAPKKNKPNRSAGSCSVCYSIGLGSMRGRTALSGTPNFARFDEMGRQSLCFRGTMPRSGGGKTTQQTQQHTRARNGKPDPCPPPSLPQLFISGICTYFEHATTRNFFGGVTSLSSPLQAVSSLYTADRCGCNTLEACIEKIPRRVYHRGTLGSSAAFVCHWAAVEYRNTVARR